MKSILLSILAVVGAFSVGCGGEATSTSSDPSASSSTDSVEVANVSPADTQAQIAGMATSSAALTKLLSEITVNADGSIQVPEGVRTMTSSELEKFQSPDSMNVAERLKDNGGGKTYMKPIGGMCAGSYSGPLVVCCETDGSCSVVVTGHY